MPFCEECGHKLTNSDIFCENCGTKIHPQEKTFTNNIIPQEREGNNLSLFCNNNWRSVLSKYSHYGSYSTGIILTRCKRLAKHLDIDFNTLLNTAECYIQQAKDRNVNYYLLDLDDNVIIPHCCSINDNIKLLKTISSVHDIKYIFILGNEEIVEVADWKNQTGDNDDNIYSDLPYVTFSTESPWDNIDFDWNTVTRVGRLPTTENCWNDFKNYFINVQQHFEKNKSVSLQPYGLSTLSWQKESEHEYSKISSGAIYTSPDVDKEDVLSYLNCHNANLLYFNLHGSDDTELWYGEDNGTFPETVYPEIFDGYKDFFILGVEACYGARYIGLPREKSILKTVLANRCLAFLGASKIAYGTAAPEGCCADIIVGKFMEYVFKCHSSGDAYIAGIKKLADTSNMDDSDIKTVAEFSLYGDPAVCWTYSQVIKKDIPSINQQMHSGIKTVQKYVRQSRNINIAMPDIGRQVRMALATVNVEIENRIDAFTAKTLLPELSKYPEKYHQKIYRMRNSDIMQKIYSRKNGHIYEIAKVYFDKSGKVSKAIVSK